MSELTFRQQVALAAIISAFIALFSAFFPSPDAHPPTDFYQSWIPSVSDGLMSTENVYAKDDRAAIAKEFGRISEMSSISELQSDIAGKTNSFAPAPSPVDLALLKILCIGDFERDYRLFRTISIFSFLFGVSLVYFSLRPNAGTIASVAVPLVAALYPPFWLDVFAGGLNSFQMLFIGLGLALFVRLDETWRYAAAAIGLTMATCIKPTVIYAVPLLVFFFLVGRGARAAAMSVLGIALAAAFSLALVRLTMASQPSWISYRQALAEFYQPQSSGSFLWHFTPVDFWIAVEGGGVFVAAIITPLAFRRVRHGTIPSLTINDVDVAAAVSLAGLAYLLFGPVIDYSQFILLVPTFLFAIFEIQRSGSLLLIAEYALLAVALALVIADPTFISFTSRPDSLPCLSYLSAIFLALKVSQRVIWSYDRV